MRTPLSRSPLSLPEAADLSRDWQQGGVQPQLPEGRTGQRAPGVVTFLTEDRKIRWGISLEAEEPEPLVGSQITREVSLLNPDPGQAREVHIQDVPSCAPPTATLQPADFHTGGFICGRDVYIFVAVVVSR